MSLGIALKQLRTKKKMTQVELSDEFQCSRSYLSEIESDLKYPAIEFLKKYSLFFGVRISKIFQIAEKNSYHV